MSFLRRWNKMDPLGGLFLCILNFATHFKKQTREGAEIPFSKLQLSFPIGLHNLANRFYYFVGWKREVWGMWCNFLQLIKIPFWTYNIHSLLSEGDKNSQHYAQGAIKLSCMLLINSPAMAFLQKYCWGHPGLCWGGWDSTKQPRGSQRLEFSRTLCSFASPAMHTKCLSIYSAPWMTSLWSSQQPIKWSSFGTVC